MASDTRTKGKARIEGKDYVMQDGDVVEFRFNVEAPCSDRVALQRR